MAIVLDASAVLTLLNEEPGHELVSTALDEAAMSSVNLAEVVSQLADHGMTEPEIHQVVDALGIEIHDLDVAAAYAAGLLRPVSRRYGLSLGDRACLALARHLDLPALTADRAWAELDVGVEVRLLR